MREVTIVSYGQIARILRARWRTIGVVAAGLVVAATLVSLVIPKRYTATASVLVDGRARDWLEDSSGALSVPGYLATQVGLIKSERIARRVIGALHLDEDKESRELWIDDTDGRGDYRAWLAVRLQKKLEVKPSRDSSIIDIAFTAKTPQRAAEVAQGFLEAYIDTTRELKTGPSRSYSDFFDARAKVARAELERVQRKHSAFQQSSGLMVSDERYDVETARLNDLTTRLASLQANENESKSRRAEADRTPQNMPEMLSSGLIASLTIELSKQESALRSVTARLGDNHPQVQEARAAIGELRQRISDEGKRLTGSLGVNDRVNGSRLLQLEAALDEQRTKVMKLKAVRDDASVLQRDVENAQRAYDSILARASQTALASESTQTNVVTVKDASEPADPSFPRLLLNVGVALLLGPLIGAIAAIVRELRDRRIYGAEDVTHGLKEPVLLEMPVVRTALQSRLPVRPKDFRSRIVGTPLLGMRTDQANERVKSWKWPWTIKTPSSKTRG